MKSKSTSRKIQILLTNDDGIYAPGIYQAYLALSKIGEVTVVAPETEQSSVGHGITLYHPLFLKKVHRNKKFFGYAVSGKPADCVKFALEVIMKKKPDVVVSGINFGANDGCSVFYSGTVAGAREAALFGYKAMAISLDQYEDPDFRKAAKVAAQLTKVIYNNHLPRGTFLNVNVPPGKIKGVLTTRQGLEPIHGSFEKRTNPHARPYYWMTGEVPNHRQDNSIDTYALKNGFVTVTPVHCDLTHLDFLNNDLKHWDIKGD